MICKHCPINEQTADGTTVGRCWHTLKGTVCPRHGDVSVEVQRYNFGSGLTLENTFRKRKGLPLLGRRKENDQ
jgi:hypothetical protein